MGGSTIAIVIHRRWTLPLNSQRWKTQMDSAAISPIASSLILATPIRSASILEEGAARASSGRPQPVTAVHVHEFVRNSTKCIQFDVPIFGRSVHHLLTLC